MCEYEVMNVITGEQTIIFGYDVNHAFSRAKIENRSDWEVLYWEYVD